MTAREFLQIYTPRNILAEAAYRLSRWRTGRSVDAAPAPEAAPAYDGSHAR